MLLIPNDVAARLSTVEDSNGQFVLAQHPVIPVDGRNESVITIFCLTNPAMATIIPELRNYLQCKVTLSEDGNVAFLVPNSIRKHEYIDRVYCPKKGQNKWDRPPLPPHGDYSEMELYASIGRALSSWEGVEIQLANLFASLVGAWRPLPAWRAYGSVLAFSARHQMVVTAAKALFSLSKPPEDLYNGFNIFESSLKKHSTRRNEIAHGIVGHYGNIKPASLTEYIPNGLALLPSEYASNKVTINTNREWYEPFLMPSYAYTSVEIKFFEQCFDELESECKNVNYMIRQYQIPDYARHIDEVLRQNPHLIPPNKNDII